MTTLKPLRIAFASAAAVFAAVAHSQSMAVAYDYDAAGNRVARRVVCEQPPQQALRRTGPSTMMGGLSVEPTVADGAVTVRSTADLASARQPWTLSAISGSTTATGELSQPVTTIVIDGASGMYLLTVITADGPATFKILKR